MPKFLNYHPIHDSSSTTTDPNTATTNDTATAPSTSIQNNNEKIDKNDNEEYCHSKQKMGSSSITNVLPRMEKLNGPYGMYATVYGISTKIVHVAHPTPAKIILTGDCSYSNGHMNSKSNSYSYSNTKIMKRQSSTKGGSQNGNIGKGKSTGKGKGGGGKGQLELGIIDASAICWGRRAISFNNSFCFIFNCGE